MSDIAIIGAGMAGFGAAQALAANGVRPVIYEKRSRPGGHTSSHEFPGGFIFDEGPHISFTEDERIQHLLADAVEGAYETIDAYVDNYWQGQLLKHPAQCNLHGLNVEFIVKIIQEFVEAAHAEPGPINNYEDWLIASYGQTFAEQFPARYGHKYHTVHPREMSTDWLGPRLYRPDLEEVLRGAMTHETPHVHYISHFRYPTTGGFGAYLDGMREEKSIIVDHEVIGIDPERKELSFSGGKTAGYDRLISSMPLPSLIKAIKNAPEDVRTAAARLACSSCVVVNVVLDRPDISKAHWRYIYDEDISIARLSFPHMLSPNNVPEGMGSIQAEVYFSDKYKPFDGALEAVERRAIEELRRMELIGVDEPIVFSNAMYIPWANIIFDLDRANALGTVQSYLEETGIVPCGRYGEWAYIWTDESYTSGEAAAAKVLG